MLAHFTSSSTRLIEEVVQACFEVLFRADGSCSTEVDIINPYQDAQGPSQSAYTANIQRLLPIFNGWQLVPVALFRVGTWARSGSHGDFM